MSWFMKLNINLFEINQMHRKIDTSIAVFMKLLSNKPKVYWKLKLYAIRKLTGSCIIFIVFHCAVIYTTAQHSTVQLNTALHCNVMYYTLYYIVIYYTKYYTLCHALQCTYDNAFWEHYGLAPGTFRKINICIQR